MKLSTLQNLWQAKNKSGNIWSTDSAGHLSNETIKGSKKFAVTYSENGKIYTYTASSVYKMAERFNLIPESNLDYWQESRKAIDAIKSGNTFTSICGLNDTICHIVKTELNLNVCVNCEHVGLDEYDRQLYKYIHTFINMMKIGVKKK